MSKRSFLYVNAILHLYFCHVRLGGDAIKNHTPTYCVHPPLVLSVCRWCVGQESSLCGHLSCQHWASKWIRLGMLSHNGQMQRRGYISRVFLLQGMVYYTSALRLICYIFWQIFRKRLPKMAAPNPSTQTPLHPGNHKNTQWRSTAASHKQGPGRHKMA